MRSVSYLKRSMLEKDKDTPTWKMHSFIKMSLPDEIFTIAVRKTIEETIMNEDFMMENQLNKLHDIYIIDQYCNIKLHLINETGKELDRNLVATIKV